MNKTDFGYFITTLQKCLKLDTKIKKRTNYALKFFHILIGDYEGSKYYKETKEDEKLKCEVLAELEEKYSEDSLEKAIKDRPITLELAKFLLANIKENALENYLTANFSKDNTIKNIVSSFKPYVRIGEKRCGIVLTNLFIQILQNCIDKEKKLNVIFINESNDSNYDDSRENKIYGNRLIEEFNCSCPICKKSLFINNEIKNYFILPIEIDKGRKINNLIPLCNECGLKKIYDPTYELEVLKMLKKHHENLYKAKNRLCGLEFQTNVLNALKEISKNLNYSFINIDLTNNINAVKQKIPFDDALLLKVTQLSAYTYYSINNIIRNLSIVDEIRANIKFAYLTIKENIDDQEEIFFLLTNYLMTKVSMKQSIAEIIVSFFIRDCEVFKAYETA